MTIEDIKLIAIVDTILQLVWIACNFGILLSIDVLEDDQRFEEILIASVGLVSSFTSLILMVYLTNVLLHDYEYYDHSNDSLNGWNFTCIILGSFSWIAYFSIANYYQELYLGIFGLLWIVYRTLISLSVHVAISCDPEEESHHRLAATSNYTTNQLNETTIKIILLSSCEEPTVY